MKKPIYPGWRMTVAQHGAYFRLWAAACAAQGWDKLRASEREARRHEIHDRLFGPGKSAKDIDRKKEFDAIKHAFAELAGSIQAQDEMRVRLEYCAKQRLRALGEVVAPRYLATLLKDRFKIIAGVRTLADLSDKALTDLIRTCNARLAMLKEKSTSETIPF